MPASPPARVADLCAVPGLEVSVAGYYEQFVRRASAAQRRHLSDDALLAHIKAVHAETHGGYGRPRTWKALLSHEARPIVRPLCVYQGLAG